MPTTTEQLKDVLDAAFDAVKQEWDSLAESYKLRLRDYEAHSAAVLTDLAAGVVTLEQAEVAAAQELNAVKSTLLAGGYDAAKQAAASALNVAGTVLATVLKLAVAA